MSPERSWKTSRVKARPCWTPRASARVGTSPAPRGTTACQRKTTQDLWCARWPRGRRLVPHVVLLFLCVIVCVCVRMPPFWLKRPILGAIGQIEAARVRMVLGKTILSGVPPGVAVARAPSGHGPVTA